MKSNISEPFVRFSRKVGGGTNIIPITAQKKPTPTALRKLRAHRKVRNQMAAESRKKNRCT